MAESHLEFTKPAHVVGRYALYGRLAAGGMATVHLGRMLELDGTSRTVAVKRLHPQFCKDPEFVAMFIDEARLAARIKHPNVVETLDILTMGQELLLVMEYIRGECFSKLLRAARRKNLEPSIGVVGHIASGMLHGLHAAHEAKDDRGEPLHVVHRDISPQNVMIEVDGGVKVLDFGVAKASARIQITRDGQMKGKLSYMSPEQLQGMPVDRRADVFACGVVLWEALTRRRLFVGEDASEVLRKILRDEVPRPSEFIPELTPAMDEVVLRALCKDPERRYQTAEELALDIERVIGLASANDVTAWIYSVAGEILTKRERLLEEIERLGSEGLPVPSADAAAGGSVHGSITDSDTFQRIQSWAEREAARAADLPSHPSIELDDAGSEAAATVADARLENGAGLPSTSLTSAAFPPPINPLDSAPAVPLEEGPLEEGPLEQGLLEQGPLEQGLLEQGLLGEVSLEDEEVEDEPTSRAALLPDAALASVGLRAPVFSHVLREDAESIARNKRRMLALLSAAGVFGALTLVAVLAVQPVALVRTSEALRPEATTSASTKAAPGAAVLPAAATPERGAVVALAAAAETEPPMGQAAAGSSFVPAGVTSPVAAVSPGALAPAVGAASAGAASAPAASGARPASATANDPSMDGAAANRVSLALTQPAKERVQSPPKRATKRAPPPRRVRAAAPPKPAPAAPAATASNKLDCKQPFWIDEKGIRRLKMACL